MGNVTLARADIGDLYNVFWSNGRFVGQFYMEIDGYYVYAPSTHDRFVDSEFLKEIARELEILNEPWHKELANDPSITGLVTVDEDSLNDAFDILKQKLVPLLIKKNSQYGDAWQGYGIVGQIFRLYEKLMRYKTLTADEVSIKVNSAEILDTLRDLFGTILLMYMYALEKSNLVKHGK